ncbi:MAG TPA: NAD(P)/FAD-dependent oxidoreductase [Pseudonocardiaceae bacterium]|jgi:2-polyprenyl-6-methoxyphenol hydroxylase-like FAD-dependent oxidoreductase|nr:NAD(P)/FAD-dependent oxidoreductase [Pseudonocardiaceae bacterium]
MSSAEQDTPESFDVVVIGGRISGAALSIQLAGAGRSVLVVDRAQFPSDTLSTHLIQVSGVRSMQKLGVLDALASTGAPFLTAAAVDYDGIELSAPVRAEADWPPGGISINRNLLDIILVDAAREAGVQVRTKTSLVDVRRDAAGRVNGVVLRGKDGEYLVHTGLLVGADGRNSKVAQLIGARTYNVTENQRFVYWAEFEGANETGSPAVHHYRRGEKLTVAFQSDGGRFVVMICPGLEEFSQFKRNLPQSYDDAVADCAPLRGLLADAHRASRPIGTAYAPGYFRESAGAGWVLVGDAGHFKDPTLGQGISDALRQAEALAEHVSAVGVTDRVGLDRQLRRWYRWRDADATPMYWLGWDFAKAGELGPLERALMACISADPTIRQQFVDGVLSHRVSPYEVIGPRLLVAVARRLRRAGCPPLEVARLIGVRLRDELRHQMLLRRPKYAPLPKPSGAASAAKIRDGDAWAGDIAEDRTPVDLAEGARRAHNH